MMGQEASASEGYGKARERKEFQDSLRKTRKGFLRVNGDERNGCERGQVEQVFAQMSKLYISKQ